MVLAFLAFDYFEVMLLLEYFEFDGFFADWSLENFDEVFGPFVGDLMKLFEFCCDGFKFGLLVFLIVKHLFSLFF